MNLKGMERLIFSKAFYDVNDFEKTIEFFKNLEKDSRFSSHILDRENKKFSGSFIRAYPKDHWNPLSRISRAMQAVGEAYIEEGILKISTMTKSALIEIRKILEDSLKDDIVFQKEEFKDPLK